MNYKSQINSRFLLAIAFVLSGLLFGSAVPGAGSTAVASTIPLCLSSQLNVMGGRQGENTTAAGLLEFVNISARPCRLSGVPRLQLVKPSGLALTPITYGPPSEAMTSAVLTPTSEAELMTNWSNWCRQVRPSSLNIKITLPGGAGSLVAPFDGPPNYNMVPQCINKNSVSKFMIVGGYRQKNFPLGSSTHAATVTGAVIACLGTVFSSKSVWKGLVTLTKNGKIIVSEKVTKEHWQAGNNPTFTLRVTQGIYVLSSTGTAGWKKFIYLEAGKTVKVNVGSYCF
jgi:hypothetical protein